MRTGARIYRHTDGRWEARYPKGRRPDGRIRYGSVYGGSYEEAGQRRAELLRSLPPEESGMTDGSRSAAGTARSRPAYPEPLTEADVRELLSHAGHWSGQERLAVCLALCCGVSCEELAALRYSDVDLTGGALRISRRMTDARPAPGLLTYPEPRVLPLPETVMADAGLAELIRSGGDRFVLTDASVPVRSLRAARMLWGRLLPAGMPQRFTPEALRATFIRRALENGLNAETVSRITGLTVPVLRSRYGQYAGANPGLLRAMDGFVRPEDCRVRQMNLLILGAGSHGHAVYEIAERLGVFQKIAFLDDAVTGDRVIGKLEDCLRYREEYPACFIAIGNNERRRELARRVTEAGFLTPRLVSGEAAIARGVQIGRGSIVMPQATVNAGAEVGEFCIIASNALIGFHARVEDYAHCDCASVVMKDCTVPGLATVESGEILREKQGTLEA